MLRPDVCSDGFARVFSHTEGEMGGIVNLGVFVADVAFRAIRQPRIGETLIGRGFALGPGGKGSNQAVAAARLGASVSFVSSLGDDSFGKMALELWERESIRFIGNVDPESFTGAAYIFVNEVTGDNAIIVVPGAGDNVSPQHVESVQSEIKAADLFMTQLETPVETARRGLQIAKDAGIRTLLNPAPATSLDDGIISLCDYLTPNEAEAADLTGQSVSTVEDAVHAASLLRKRGAGTVIITLGEKGAYFDDGAERCHIEPFSFAPVVETTGAGDSFCGAFAHAIITGMDPRQSVRYACAAAGISVTRKGTAPSMPTFEEVQNLLSRG